MLHVRRALTSTSQRCLATHSSSTEKSIQRGKPSKLVDEFIRVDHAGELGADRIYAGQMAILGLFEFCFT